MDKITFRQIYFAIGCVFATFTVGFVYVLYYAAQKNYDHPAIYFMVGLAACMTLGISITVFIIGRRSQN